MRTPSKICGGTMMMLISCVRVCVCMCVWQQTPAPAEAVRKDGAVVTIKRKKPNFTSKTQKATIADEYAQTVIMIRDAQQEYKALLRPLEEKKQQLECLWIKLRGLQEKEVKLQAKRVVVFHNPVHNNEPAPPGTFVPTSASVSPALASSSSSSLSSSSVQKPYPNITDWVQQQHQQMQQAMSQATSSMNSPNRYPALSEYDDRVTCPCCRRKFTAKAAKRHIRVCRKISRNRSNMKQDWLVLDKWVRCPHCEKQFLPNSAKIHIPACKRKKNRSNMLLPN